MCRINSFCINFSQFSNRFFPQFEYQYLGAGQGGTTGPFSIFTPATSPVKITSSTHKHCDEQHVQAYKQSEKHASPNSHFVHLPNQPNNSSVNWLHLPPQTIIDIIAINHFCRFPQFFRIFQMW